MMSSSDKLRIPLQELSSATNGFAEANIIGKGGYGLVYRGQSEQHGLIAIKRLNRVLGQGDHEYGMEVSLLSKYKHENLVSLIGFCGENDEKILVYKYEANQSLDKYLHNSKDLNWMRRLQICLGVARGLRYLHDESGSGHRVIHRDVKSSNILLDENWKAKISDFGLSKIALTNSADSIVFTMACGTRGYVDPQILHGSITQKSDVYSFGVVLYEVLLGKLVASTPEYVGDVRFTVKMAKKHYEEKTLQTMIDPDLTSEMNLDSLNTFASIAYECLKKHPKDRPTMRLVVEALEKVLGYQEASNRGVSLRLSSLSSSSPPPLRRGFLYDVFISYIEIACQQNILSGYLARALKREGFSYYKHNFSNYKHNNFWISHDQPSTLLSTIKQSRSFIILFNDNFGASSWKLNEVVDIMDCVKETRNLVLPVFCLGVTPSDVRKQKGEFGKLITKFDRSTPKMKAWRNALIEATNLPGLEESAFRNYSEITNEVVARIKLQLPRKDSDRKEKSHDH